ncbi:MAG: hypothetical protein ABW321_02140 [Polyangiales bacterium]
MFFGVHTGGRAWVMRLLLIVVGCCTSTWPRALHAQPPDITPPRLISLPSVVLPADVAAPEGGSVEATVLIDAEGHASMDGCAADEALCTRVRDAIGQALFEPARRGAEAIPARIRIALRITAPEAQPESPAGDSNTAPPITPPAPSPPPTAAPATDASTAPAAVGGITSTPPAAESRAPDTTEPGTYGAQGRVKQLQQPGMRRLELAEMRDLPGAFGDPFRAIDALPGVVPLFSGLPYVYVRGSPPTGSLYFYDGIQLPSLYHLAIGPAAIHPAMVGPIRLYSGVAPARYGRLTGGVIAGEGPEPPDGRTHVQVDLRLLDVSGYVQADALGGTLTVAGRYGYPALLLSIFSPQVDVAYWDYQLRYALPISAHNRLELVSIGSYDSLSFKEDAGDTPTDLLITYHRLEPRFIHQHAGRELGAAVTLGWERSGLDTELNISSTRVTPRAWFEQRLGSRSRLRLSADATSLWGGLRQLAGRADSVRELGVGNIGYGLRGAFSLQAELTLRPWTALELQLGARGDLWLQPGARVFAFDPRGRIILHASETLDFHVAAGLVHQPAVAFLPLPGIADFADARDLQRALQTEAGVGWDLPIDLRAELQVFAHRYEDLIFTDRRTLVNAYEDICSGDALSCNTGGIPAFIDGTSYGLELFLRRPFTHALSGFISYTLAWSRVGDVAGLRYTPSWDVRHVANLVIQWQIGGGFSAGLRGFVRSGKVQGRYYINEGRLDRAEFQLPGFPRLDAEVAYAWRTGWGRMRFALEWFNVTLSAEPQAFSSWDPTSPPPVDYLPAIFVPNLSLRGEL